MTAFVAYKLWYENVFDRKIYFCLKEPSWF